MKYQKTWGAAALTLCGVFAASSASAALVHRDCLSPPEPSAIANNLDPTACASGMLANQGIGTQENAVNAYFGGGFSHLGKVDDGGAFDSEGYQDLQMALVPGADPWDFGFTVTSASYAGQAIDFVLLVKQGTQPEFAYYWEGIALDIEGFFTSFNINPTDGDFSHFSGLVRFSDTPVPEPGTLALLGLGLLGLGFVRRRMTA